jgi:hypothetical protein
MDPAVLTVYVIAIPIVAATSLVAAIAVGVVRRRR